MQIRKPSVSRTGMVELATSVQWPALALPLCTPIKTRRLAWSGRTQQISLNRGLQLHEGPVYVCNTNQLAITATAICTTDGKVQVEMSIY